MGKGEGVDVEWGLVGIDISLGDGRILARVCVLVGLNGLVVVVREAEAKQALVHGLVVELVELVHVAGEDKEREAELVPVDVV